MFIVISILIFGLIIAIHEFGHYISAKLFKVGVPEFAIGMGPKILKKQGKETLYSLRAIPIGGFCSMDGDDNEEQGEKSLFSKPLWQRIIIFASGSVLNIVAGFLILLLLVSTMMPILPTTTLAGFLEGFPLESEQGFQAGDRFHSIDGVRVYQNANIGMLLDMRSSETVDVVVIRDGQRVQLNNLPLERQTFVNAQGEEEELFGFLFERIDQPTFINRVSYTVNNTRDFMRQLPLTIRMFTTGQANLDDVSSVVGIVDIMNEAGTTAETAGLAVFRLAMIAAIISISVAMVNLLPIPGLDGGRIFLMIVTTVIERITRRRVNPKVEGYINTAGLALLFGFMIFIILSDIVQIAVR
ncbi:MAG: site-2 protease family protein [Oscillospiraceae bacterium]|nr:site-2 protease family protein [Oscillospiraceae bacterium]